MKWINILSESPKEQGTYLTFGSIMGITTAMYFNNGSWSLSGITHWMYLPEEPKDIDS